MSDWTDGDPTECAACYHDWSWHTPFCEACIELRKTDPMVIVCTEFQEP